MASTTSRAANPVKWSDAQTTRLGLVCEKNVSFGFFRVDCSLDKLYSIRFVLYRVFLFVYESACVALQRRFDRQRNVSCRKVSVRHKRVKCISRGALNMVDKRSDRLGHKNGLTHREFIKFVLGGLAAAVDGLLFGELACPVDSRIWQYLGSNISDMKKNQVRFALLHEGCSFFSY